MASGGTLFLDEIGNLSLPLQAKILTAIQKREIVRIGSNNPVQVDIRLVSATNMPLYEMAESFRFRQDLLYRINTVEILLPPLRSRKEDISLLAFHFLRFYCNQYNKPEMRMDEQVISKLEGYSWPGNIRELAHCMERAVILNKSGKIVPEDFNLRSRLPSITDDVKAVTVEDYEKKAISTALEKHCGNLSKAAEELKIARSTLYRKIAHFGILSDNIIK
jgi:transcriptional regulator with PAS, ATPase and Fis domain